MSRQEVTVISRKYDLSIRRSWRCRLESQKGALITLVGSFDEAVDHPELGEIKKGTVSSEYYWLDQWFNVFRFQKPSGELRNFYCNISMPPNYDGTTLDYVDLDIDVILWPDGRIDTLDEDDFAQNAGRFCYPLEVRHNALASLERIQAIIKGREFPFDNF